jgi:hypothetical protein
VLGSIPEGIPPTRVLRFANHCLSECPNRIGESCGLIERFQVAKPPAAENAPRCHLRPRCKWWQQVGLEACRRCPAITTMNSPDDQVMALVADPATTLDQLEHWMAEAEGTATGGARDTGEGTPGHGRQLDPLLPPGA